VGARRQRNRHGVTEKQCVNGPSSIRA
jgi:hypothetical protein